MSDPWAVPTEPAPKRRRRNRLPLLIVGVALLALGVGFGAWWVAGATLGEKSPATARVPEATGPDSAARDACQEFRSAEVRVQLSDPAAMRAVGTRAAASKVVEIRVAGELLLDRARAATASDEPIKTIELMAEALRFGTTCIEQGA